MLAEIEFLFAIMIRINSTINFVWSWKFIGLKCTSRITLNIFSLRFQNDVKEIRSITSLNSETVHSGIITSTTWFFNLWVDSTHPIISVINTFMIPCEWCIIKVFIFVPYAPISISIPTVWLAFLSLERKWTSSFCIIQSFAHKWNSIETRSVARVCFV